MTLREHYRNHSRKSIKPYFILLLLLTFVIICSDTISRYTSGAVFNSLMNIAKWSIIINGEEINNSENQLNTNISLLSVKDNTNNVSAGEECYFDIIINPTTTEVSISYSIDIDLNISNLPNDSLIEKYEEYENTEENENLIKTEENINERQITLSEDIILSEQQTSLDSGAIRRYRIYCIIGSSNEINNEEDLYVDPQITVKQLIEE